ncbi:MAG: hypothetical protein GY696_25630, partial [Gammaproteobacteria bacterium]|nr:hypothetical protein [Gammaproteobacteria bacterium]
MVAASSSSADESLDVDSDGTEEVYFVAKKKGTGKNRNYLVRKPKGQDATCDKRPVSKAPCGNCGKEDHTNRDPRCPARDKKCSFCGTRGHYAAWCRKAARRQQRDSQTTNMSTVLEHHPSVDAVHDDRRIRCSLPLQPIGPNI